MTQVNDFYAQMLEAQQRAAEQRVVTRVALLAILSLPLVCTATTLLASYRCVVELLEHYAAPRLLVVWPSAAEFFS